MAPRPITDSDDGRTIAFSSRRNEVGPHCTEMTTDSQRNLRAQTRTATLPIIVLTAQSGESEEKALHLGSHGCLTKPLQTRSLVARGRALLERINT